MSFIKKINEPLPKLKPISGQEAFDDLVNYLMGERYYIVDPVSVNQGNALILEEVKRAFPRPLKKRFWKKLSIKLISWSEKLNRWAETIH